MVRHELDLRPPPGPDADGLTVLLYHQEGVIGRRQALRHLSAKAVQHRLETGRWQVPHPGVYVTHTGPVTREQRRWIAVLAAGAGRPRAVLAGISALEQLGLRGHRHPGLYVLIPAHRQDRDPPPGVVLRRTRRLLACDVHHLGLPPCTMPPRSVVDAAQWAPTDDRARTIVAAAFQQGLVGGDEVHRVLDVGHWWADMRRQNDLWISGVRVLRFPAWVVRERPGEVAAQVRAALVAAGWHPDRGLPLPRGG